MRSWTDIRNEVKREVGATSYNEMLAFLDKEGILLWGTEQPDFYVEFNLVVWLWKEIRGVGYDRILADIEKPTPFSTKSFQHNVKTLRRTLAVWARLHVKLGDLQEWQVAAQSVYIPPSLQGCCLWADSSDFPIKRGPKRGKKSHFWSFKLNRPGWRMMAFSDGKGKILKLWGGYSPKIYDGHFLHDHKHWLEKHLRGGVVVADQHFEYGRTNLQGIKFHVPWKTPASGKRKAGAAGSVTLSEEKIKYNKEVRALRARVEIPFVFMKNKFKSLAKPWMDKL
jgi:hypothetical protein